MENENKKIEEQDTHKYITFTDELMDEIYGKRGEDLREEFEKSVSDYRKK